MTFFDSYSYKKKNFALLVVAVLLFAACYKRAFKITIELIGYKQELLIEKERAKHAVQQIRRTQDLIRRYDALVGKENSTIEQVQQGVLNALAAEPSIRVVEVDEVLQYKHPDFTINTHKLVLNGGFCATLKTINTLERTFQLAKLSSVQFEFKTYDSDSPPSLFTTILLQNYQQ